MKLKNNFMTSKKYRVSLAVLLQHNFEAQVKAKSEKEAYEKAVDAFENDEWEKVYGVIEDCDGAEPYLDLSDDVGEDGLPKGAYVELLDNQNQ